MEEKGVTAIREKRPEKGRLRTGGFEDKVVKISLAPIKFSSMAIFDAGGKIFGEGAVDAAIEKVELLMGKVPSIVDGGEESWVGLPFDVEIPFWNGLGKRRGVKESIGPEIKPEWT